MDLVLNLLPKIVQNARERVLFEIGWLVVLGLTAL